MRRIVVAVALAAILGGVAPAEGRLVVKGRVSTFGPPTEGWMPTASGISVRKPGIALYRSGTMGRFFCVRIGRHQAILRQTDFGPAPWTGRKIDVTGAGSRRLGINPHRFPTDRWGRARLLPRHRSAWRCERS